MLQIKHLTLTHHFSQHTLLEDFSLALRPGDHAVIIGEEGNGKSTLLRWIHDPASISGYIDARGERIAGGEVIGYLPQQLPEAEGDRSVCEFFTADGQFWDCPHDELLSIARKLRLGEAIFYSDQKMHTLSGGEKIKIQMARLLLQRPTVLLLDEPSNDIDLETLSWLEEMIQTSGAAILYVSHDETLIERTANRVIHLEQLRRKSVCRHTIANVDYRTYAADRESRMENEMRQALGERREERAALERFRRIQQKVEHAQSGISRQDPHSGRLLKKKMASVKAMERRYGREHEGFTEIPETEEAAFLRFGGEIRLPPGKMVLELGIDELRRPERSAADSGGFRETAADDDAPFPHVLARNIRLVVRGPEKICIIGKNGAGKTTLLRRIAEELLARDDIRAAYMPQDYEDGLDPELSPVDFLAPSGSKEDRTRVRTYLGSLKYTADEMLQPIGGLSGGQKAKLFLLKLSISGADVLLLDEPTRNLSPLTGPVLREVLRGYGGAIISVSHDRKFIAEVCGRVCQLTEDGLSEMGPP